MTPDDQDAGLREKFQLLKRQDQALVPEFERCSEPLRRPRRLWAPNFRFISAALALILFAGIAAGVWRGGFWKRPRPSEAPIAQLSQWHAPTDSLLQTPGGQLLRTLPRFGEPLVGDQIFSPTEMK